MPAASVNAADVSNTLQIERSGGAAGGYLGIDHVMLVHVGYSYPELDGVVRRNGDAGSARYFVSASAIGTSPVPRRR